MTRALLAALALALALCALQTWRIDRIKADLIEARIEIASLNEFKRVAVDDAKTQADQCQARVDDARRSAQRIETIVERPYEVDPAGCPVRSTLDAASLRDALQPDADPAKPVR